MDKVWSLRTLETAWKNVAKHRGAANVDRMSIERFKAQEEQYLAELSEALREGSYEPEAVRRVPIPKGKGATRPLGIPTVKARIVPMALKRVLEPIFEKEFEPISYGFRPERGCKDALQEADGRLKAGAAVVVDADIASDCDAIPRPGLMERLKERVSDGAVLKRAEAFLGQEVRDGLKRWTATTGTPQGAVLSPLLASIYRHPLDREMTEAGYKRVHYADDFVVLCRTRDEAESALARIRSWMNDHGLMLHPEKTQVGNCLEAGPGFECLGYRFEGGRRLVRHKSLKALKDKIRQKTQRTCGKSVERIIADFNLTLRGGFEYFKQARRTTLQPIDGFVRRRLPAVLRKQQKRPG